MDEIDAPGYGGGEPDRIIGAEDIVVHGFRDVKGHGMKDLIGALVRRRTSAGELSRSDGYLLTSARHKAAVDRAVEALQRAIAALDDQPPEIIALEVRLAREALDEIAGQALPDDGLDIIFSRFCIGK